MFGKYELTKEKIKLRNGKVLYRIKALRDFSDVKAGDLGGFVESVKNLSHDGNCWIYNDAQVYDSAQVLDNAKICGNARIRHRVWIYNDAQVYDSAKVYGNTKVYDSAKIYGNSRVSCCEIRDNAQVYDNADVAGKVWIRDNAQVFDNARIHGDTRVLKNAKVYGDTKVYGCCTITRSIPSIKDYMCIGPIECMYGYVTFIKTKNNIHTYCMSYSGFINGFEKEIRRRCKNDDQQVKECLLIIDFVKNKFNL